MSGFLLRRLAGSLVLLLLVLTTTFILLRLIPGDPTNFAEDQRLSREQRENLRRIYGLDRPLPEQYVRGSRRWPCGGIWECPTPRESP